MSIVGMPSITGQGALSMHALMSYFMYSQTVYRRIARLSIRIVPMNCKRHGRYNLVLLTEQCG